MQKESEENRVPVPFPKKSTPHDAHTFSTDEKEYDVYALINLASNIEPREVDVAQLKGQVLAEPCWTDVVGNRFSPRNLLDAYGEYQSWAVLERTYPEWVEHIGKIKTADYQYPILLHNGELIDGMHRLLKAIIEGVSHIPTRSFDRLPDEAFFLPSPKL